MTITLKFEETWTKTENIFANSNFKALNTIFATIDVIQFKLISVRDAWIILQNAHERTSSVKISKLQMLASKFEDLRMLEDETISDSTQSYVTLLMKHSLLVKSTSKPNL